MSASARLFQTRYGWGVSMPCVNHGSGELHIVMTQHHTRGAIPSKQCNRCGLAFPVLAFLKGGRLKRNGYYEVFDDDMCHFCEDPTPIELHTDQRGRLRMELRLRLENGQSVLMFDPHSHRWVHPRTLGLRRMTKDGNELRLQSQQDRSVSRLRGLSYTYLQAGEHGLFDEKENR